MWRGVLVSLVAMILTLLSSMMYCLVILKELYVLLKFDRYLFTLTLSIINCYQKTGAFSILICLSYEYFQYSFMFTTNFYIIGYEKIKFSLNDLTKLKYLLAVYNGAVLGMICV